jgi:hypothetical protein
MARGLVARAGGDSSPFSKIRRLLVRLNHVARFIVNPDHSIM